MITTGIYKLIFGHPDPKKCTFFKDAGMRLDMVDETCVWSTINGSSIDVVKSDTIGLVRVEWLSDTDYEFVDPNSVKHVFRSDVKFVEVPNSSTKTNTYNYKVRINKQIEILDTTTPCAIAHVAIFTSDLTKSRELFERAGFVVSDSIEGKCVFMRSKENNPHHQLLLAYSAEKQGLQHAALAVNDIYTVFTKGLNMASNGWTTLLGPGRHVISSSTHWYFNTELGAFELTADEDYLTNEWQPTVYDPIDSVVYEWAIEGGLDPCTRRQTGVELQAKFIDQRMK